MRNLLNIGADATLAGNRVLVADQTRRAERYPVAESVIDAMMELELDARVRDASHKTRSQRAGVW